MNPKPTIQHISLEEIMDYFSAVLPETREGQIEEHLAVCDTCTTLSRQIHALSHMFDSWTTKAHGEAYQRMILTTALQQVQTQVQNPHWRGRLLRWQGSWAGKAQAAVRLVLNAHDFGARLVTEGLEALVDSEGAWEFVLATRLRMRGTGICTRDASRTLSLNPDKPQARIKVQGNTQEVEIRVDYISPEQTPPLVILIPTQEGTLSQVTELERQEGVTYLISRFTNVIPGDYLMAFEPIEQ